MGDLKGEFVGFSVSNSMDLLKVWLLQTTACVGYILHSLLSNVHWS